jgi:hypothetical protein
MLVPAIALLLLSACGGGGGGGDVAVVPLPTTVFLDDAPIIGARVQDRGGASGSQDASGSIPAGTYQFELPPTLPLKISSRNYVDTNGRVAVVQIGGLWYSYQDSNRNGRWDEETDPVQPLTFQDVDGNGLYTQSVDIVVNGWFPLNYAKPGSTAVQANVVASLLPPNWNGTTPVAGISAAALNAAVSVGPTNSAKTGSGVSPEASAELRRATAVLTAISEGLVSTLTSSGSTAAQTQATVSNALAAIANSGVNVTATDATSIGQVASAVSGSVPQAATQANNLVSNVMSIASGAATNFEAVVKVTQDKLSQMASNASQQVLLDLKQTVSEVDVSIGLARVEGEEKPGVDPDVARIAGLRLMAPFFEADLPPPGVKFGTVDLGIVESSDTTGFFLERQQDGTIQFGVSGSRFAPILGPGSSVSVPFLASLGRWEFTRGNESLSIAVNVSTEGFMGVTSIRHCTSDAKVRCRFYLAASREQICSTVTQDQLSKINAINLVGPNRPAVTCN